MNFDRILDKTWIDFQNVIETIRRENIALQSMKIFTFLTDKVQQEILENKNLDNRIEQAYAFENIQPSMKLLDDIGFDWADQYNEIQKAHIPMKLAHSYELWSKVDKCATDSTYTLYKLSILMVMKRFHQKCEIRDFLFCIMKI